MSVVFARVLSAALLVGPIVRVNATISSSVGVAVVIYIASCGNRRQNVGHNKYIANIRQHSSKLVVMVVVVVEGRRRPRPHNVAGARMVI